jgi:hypothetical protein
VSKGEGGRRADLLASLGGGRVWSRCDVSAPSTAQSSRADPRLRNGGAEASERDVQDRKRIGGRVLDGLELRGLDYDYIGWSEII